jgi:poly(A) polymerase
MSSMFQKISSHFPYTRGVYFVGGAVRDDLAGRRPLDYDLAVSNRPHEFAAKLSRATGGHMVTLGKKETIIIRVTTQERSYDISPVYGNTIQEDLLKRDFTINAMAYCPDSHRLMDPCGGLIDLENKKIRMVAKNIFTADPLRLIRAYRIGAQLNFRIESQTNALLAKFCDLAPNPAGERIREELLKFFRTTRVHQYLVPMAHSGILQSLFPELQPLMGCFQGGHHNADAFDHSLNTCGQLEALLNKSGRSKNSCKKSPIYQISSEKNRTALLKFAALFHDIGKPHVKIIDKHGKIRFFRHDGKGADLVRQICRRLKFSQKEQHYMEFLIRHHMQPLFLYNAHRQGELTERGIIRFFMRCRTHVPDLLLHALADMLAKGKKPDSSDLQFQNFMEHLSHKFHSAFKQKTTEIPLITGHDLIHHFNLTPSPIFKTILNKIEESRFCGEIDTRDAALERVAELLKTMKNGDPHLTS